MRAIRTLNYLVATTALLTILDCGEAEDKHLREDLPLKTVEVKIETIRPHEVATLLEAVGTIRSEVTTQLSSRIMGYVTEVKVDEGDKVRRGQLLAQIDSRETKTQIKKAEAGLNEAESAGVEVDRAIRASESGLEAAQANAQLAESTHKRFKELLSRKSVSQQEFEEVDARYRAAQAEVKQAKEILSSVVARRQQVHAKVDQAKANLANAQIYHGHSRITCPLDGIVTSKNVEVGQLASPGAPLFTVENGRDYRLDATVQESRMRFLSVSQALTVRVDALDEELVGHVAEIVPVADPISRSFTVKIDLPFHPQLRSGLFGRVRFPAEIRESVAVPASSIVSRGQLSGVYVIDAADKARFQLVKTGEEMGDRVEVLSGLEEGDRVVIHSVEPIQDGQPLSVVGSLSLSNNKPILAGGSL